MSYFLMLSKSHGADVLSRFQQLRVAGRMCDVVLEAGGVEFPAHRALLACSSDYFWSLFQEHTLESKAWNLSLPALCPAGLEQVLDFIYCSWLSVCPSTLEDILVAASYLQVTSATELCSRYMADSLSLNNCCFFANVAARHGLTEALAAADHFIAREMRHLLAPQGDREGLLGLNRDSLQRVLGAEEMPGVQESALLLLLLDWLHLNPLPAVHSNLLLSHVRYGLVPPDQLRGLTTRHPALRTPFIHSLVQKALQYHRQGSLQPRLQTEQTSLRANPGRILLVGGGARADRPQTLVQTYEPQTRKFHALSTRLPARLQQHCVCVLGGFLFVLGGEVVEMEEELEKTAVMTATGQVWRYDPRFERWEDEEPMIQRRAQFSCCVIDSVIYSIGGRGQRGEAALSTVEKYNLPDGCWRKGETLPHAVHGHACATLGQGVYISGGVHGDQTQSSKSVFYLDTIDGKGWESRASMTVARFGHQAVTVGQMIYSFLGMYEQFCEIERYDPTLDQWTRLKPLLNDRFCYGLAATTDGRVLLFGGRKWRDGQEVVTATVVEYDTASDTWREVCKMPAPLCGTQCVQLSILDPTEM
ncbi:LOW QUALITY PROTEIN: kelch-like protein 34 [Denticeps clupeoides]|uniref:LOW QUALITY PROTEIN: kelch-like protein 34 n=1 Tax=Denticeps clupeoides TaxID=299321 RepID=UPI0010A49277|nr:LOW QUALITY PROTEIN: kelch-like protein 34 [Denticeps clupeoides]